MTSIKEYVDRPYTILEGEEIIGENKIMSKGHFQSGSGYFKIEISCYVETSTLQGMVAIEVKLDDFLKTGQVNVSSVLSSCTPETEPDVCAMLMNVVLDIVSDFKCYYHRDDAFLNGRLYFSNIKCESPDVPLLNCQ